MISPFTTYLAIPGNSKLKRCNKRHLAGYIKSHKSRAEGASRHYDSNDSKLGIMSQERARASITTFRVSKDATSDRYLSQDDIVSLFFGDL